MKELLSILAGLIMLYSFWPYAKDILAGKVKPARSTRLMIVLLMTLTIAQQHSLGSGWVLAMTVGDAIGAVAILFLAIRMGVGGLTRLDIACYTLLAIDIIFWSATGNTLAALHLSIAGDIIAMTPVLVKTWRQPWTETPLFFALGVVAPVLSVIGSTKYTYAVLVLPIYIGIINLIEVLLIVWRQKVVPHPSRQLAIDHQPLA